MRDVLPQDAEIFDKIEGVVKSIASFYGFERIETPAVEEAGLFLRGRGEMSHFPEKELFQFRSSGGSLLALRPEGFLPVARSYIENNMADLSPPLKLFYSGRFFRDEEQRRGYQKTFHQFGLTVLGEETAVAEAEILQVFFLALSELGIKNLFIHLNSIGCFECHPGYRSQLSSYYRSKTQRLCKNCKRNFKRSPIKLLECSDEKCVIVKQNAPQVLDSICEICKNSFKELLEFFDEINIPYILDPRLMGTFNYYSRTVFKIYSEIQKDGDEKERLTIGSGGRFDTMIQNLGGKPTPAVGGVIGFERVLHLLRKSAITNLNKEAPQVFLIQLGDLSKRKSFSILENLRKADIPVYESLGKDSIKTQLKIAAKIGSPIALILGQKEAIDKTIIVREMDSGIQETTPQEKLIDLLRRKLNVSPKN